METFSNFLAVSPRTRSGNSPHRLSRGSRLRRRGGNLLRGDGYHTGSKVSTTESRDKGRIGALLRDGRGPGHFQGSPGRRPARSEGLVGTPSVVFERVQK